MPQLLIPILDYLVTDLSKLNNLKELKQFSGADSNTQIITINIEHLKTAKTNPDFEKLLKEAELLIPDGESIVTLASLSGFKIKKYAGIDLCKDLIKSHQRICFLGAEDSVIKKLEQSFPEEFREKEFYFQHGYYSLDNEAKILERISAFEPDLFIVALGVPRQDLLIAKYRCLFSNCIFIGVGGALDVLAGKLKRAPEILIKLKLEWLFRIMQEPSRSLRFIRNFIYFIELSFYFLLSKSIKR